MKTGTRRFTALLCAFCMLFSSIPSSVMSDSLPEEIQTAAATPTDLQPVENEESVTPSETEDETPQDETPEKLPADRVLEVGDDLTINGELTGETPRDYLIRFSPEKNQTMVLVLEADKELQATVTNECTGDKETFVKDHTDEGGTITWIAADYRTEKGNPYLLRISSAEAAEFTLRLVRKSIFEEEQAAEKPTEEAAGEPDEQPADRTGEEPGEATTEEPGEESGAQTTEGTAEVPAEEAAESPDDQPAEEATGDAQENTETDRPEAPDTTEDDISRETEEEAEKEKPAADREITAGDDVTVSGKMNSSGEYLIRFTPAAAAPRSISW